MKKLSEMEETASLWIVREDRGLTTAEARSMREWLDASTEHTVAYLRLRSIWQLADTPKKRQDTRPHSEQRVWAGLADARLIAAILMIAIIGSATLIYRGVGYQSAAQFASQQYFTSTDQKKTINLADGTRVDLNHNTRIRAELSVFKRTLKLDQGEVYLEIAHDPSRPFVVLAGTRRITDLGTKFSVQRENDYLKVVVKEGRVKIEELGAVSGSAPIIANGGQIAVLKGDETLLVHKEQHEIEDDLNWRNQMLVFDQDALVDVAAQFNHYNKKQILVEGKARDIRIGGRFKSDNLEAFVLLMRNAFNLRVTENRDQIIISD